MAEAGAEASCGSLAAAVIHVRNADNSSARSFAKAGSPFSGARAMNSSNFDFSGCSTLTSPADRSAANVAAASLLMYWLKSTPAAWHSAQLDGLSAFASGKILQVKTSPAASSAASNCAAMKPHKIRLEQKTAIRIGHLSHHGSLGMCNYLHIAPAASTANSLAGNF